MKTLTAMRLFAVLPLFVLILLTGCATRVEPEAPDAHLIVGLRITPEFREGRRGLFSNATNARVIFERHPLKRSIPPQFVHIDAEQGWTYRVLPVVSGFYVLHSVRVRGGGIRGEENTVMARSQKQGDGTTSVDAAYLFDVPKGSVSYIGSFDFEASEIPVEVDLSQDLAAAKAAAEKAGLDPASVVVLERNVIRGMEN